MSSEYPQNWDEIRNRVYQRDGYECQNCGIKGGRNGNAELHAHHIVPKASGGSHSEQNLVTLCKDCHNAIHHDDKEAPQPQSDSDANLSDLQYIETLEDFGKFENGFKDLVDESNFLVALLSGKKNRIILNKKEVAIQNVEETRAKLFKLKTLSKSYDIDSESIVNNSNMSDNEEAEEFIKDIMSKYTDFADRGLEMCTLCIRYIEEVTTISCLECGDSVPSSEPYCGSCGASLPSIWRCNSCGNDRNSIDNQFCSNCGAELDQIPEKKKRRINEIFKKESELEVEMRRLKNDISDTNESALSNQQSSSRNSNVSNNPSSSGNYEGNPEQSKLIGKLIIAFIILSALILFIL